MKFSATYNPYSDSGMNDPYVFYSGLAEAIHSIQSHKYSGIEISLKSIHDISAGKILPLLQSAGIEISAFSTEQICTKDGLCLASDHESIRDQASNRLNQIIDLAGTLKTSVIIGDVIGDIWSKLPGGTTDRLVKASAYFEKLVDFAEQRNVVLYYEMAAGSLLPFESFLSDAAELIRHFATPYFKLAIDTIHLQSKIFNVIDFFKKYSDVIGYLHLSDTNRLAPGLGKIELYKIFKSLFTMKYTGYLSVKVLPQPNSDFVLEKTDYILAKNAVAMFCP